MMISHVLEYTKRASKGTGPVLIGVTLANKHDYAGLVNCIERFDPSSQLERQWNTL